MAVDVFLKIDGIKGESQDDKHKDEIELLSWSWSVTNSAARRSPARAEPFNVVKLIDAASPSLFDAVCSGDAIRDAQIVVRKAGKGDGEYLKIRMDDVQISSLTPASGPSDALPMEQVSFNFEKIVIEYRRQREDGGFDAWITSSCSPRGPRGVS